MVTFSENSAPILRKNAAEADIIMSNFFKSLQFFWSQPPLLLLERVFYLLKRLGGGCFQWDGWDGVHFQMIWSGTSCINSKFIRDTRRFLVTLLRFCFVFEKYSKNLSVFTNKKTLVATLVKRVDLFLKNMWLHRV